jgi:hypothetical protein
MAALAAAHPGTLRIYRELIHEVTGMKAWLNFLKGFHQSTSLPQLILFAYGLNILVALPLAVTLFDSLKDSFGPSQVSERMSQGFDYLWWEEFRDEKQGLEATFTPALLGKGAVLTSLESLIRWKFLSFPLPLLLAACFYLVMRTLLAGGILHIYAMKENGYSWRNLLKGAAAYASHFVGLLLVGWLTWMAVLAPLSRWLDAWVSRTARISNSEITPFTLNILVSLLIFMLFFWIQMILDYARISVVIQNRRSLLRALGAGIGLVLRHPLSTIALLGMFLLVQAVATTAYLGLRTLIPQNGPLGVAAGFALLQMFIGALVWIRCWQYSSQMHLFRYLR